MGLAQELQESVRWMVASQSLEEAAMTMEAMILNWRKTVPHHGLRAPEVLLQLLLAPLLALLLVQVCVE